MPAEGKNEEQAKSSRIKVPSAADFEEDDGPETAGLRSGREIHPPKIPEKADVEEIEQVEDREGRLQKGGIVETVPDSRNVTVQGGADIRRQSSHEWEEDPTPDNGEDSAKRAALGGCAKDAGQAAVTHEASEAEKQTPKTSTRSSSQMASPSEEDKGRHVDMSQGKKEPIQHPDAEDVQAKVRSLMSFALNVGSKAMKLLVRLHDCLMGTG